MNKKVEIFSLALSETQKDERKEYLERQRQEYEFNHEYLEGLALLKKVPDQENFSATYLAERITQGADLSVNMLATTARSLFDPLDELEDYQDFFNVLRKPNIIKNPQKNYQTDSTFAEQRLSGANPLVIKSFTEMPANINISLNDLDEKLNLYLA